LECEALACGLSRERSRSEVRICPRSHRILDTERSVLFLRRLACQNRPHSFRKRRGFGDHTGPYVDTPGDLNAISMRSCETGRAKAKSGNKTAMRTLYKA